MKISDHELYFGSVHGMFKFMNEAPSGFYGGESYDKEKYIISLEHNKSMRIITFQKNDEVRVDDYTNFPKQSYSVSFYNKVATMKAF